MTYSNRSVSGVVTYWQGIVCDCEPVYRWQGHPAAQEGSYRLQSTNDHREELTSLAHLALMALKLQRCKLDEGLLLLCVWHHDDGECVLKSDVLYVNKSTERDVQEYLAFKDRVEKLRVSVRIKEQLLRAFLLQFAGKYAHDERFDEQARAFMRELARCNEAEVWLFELLERLEYMLYAFEQWVEYGNEGFILEVWGNQKPKIDALIRSAPEGIAPEDLLDDIFPRSIERKMSRVYNLHKVS